MDKRDAETTSNKPRFRLKTANDSRKRQFIAGLRNAHSMEPQAREMMERQSERLDDYPGVKAKVTAHLTDRLSGIEIKTAFEDSASDRGLISDKLPMPTNTANGRPGGSEPFVD